MLSGLKGLSVSDLSGRLVLNLVSRYKSTDENTHLSGSQIQFSLQLVSDRPGCLWGMRYPEVHKAKLTISYSPCRYS